MNNTNSATTTTTTASATTTTAAPATATTTIPAVSMTNNNSNNNTVSDGVGTKQQQQQQQQPQIQPFSQQGQYYTHDYNTTTANANTTATTNNNIPTDPYYQAQQFNNQYYYNNNMANTIPFQYQQQQQQQPHQQAGGILPLQYNAAYATLTPQQPLQPQYYYDPNLPQIQIPSTTTPNNNNNSNTTSNTTGTTNVTDEYLQQAQTLQARPHIQMTLNGPTSTITKPPVPSYRTVPHTNYGVITTMWEDENTLCYQVEANGVNVVRRVDNNFINGTKLLNVTKMTRGRRDGILKAEKVRHVVKIGSMHLKGVWIPFERAQLMAQRENILDILYPLFVPDIEALLSGN